MKKYCCFALAAAILGASVLPFSACDWKIGNDPGKTGVVDEDKMEQLVSALVSAEFDSYSLTGSVSSDTSMGGESVSKMQTDFGMKALGSDLDVQYSTLSSMEGMEGLPYPMEQSLYSVVYLRGNKIYLGSGTWEEVSLEAGDFDGLFAAHRAGDATLSYFDFDTLFAMTEDTPSASLFTMLRGLLSDPEAMDAAAGAAKRLPALIKGEGKAFAGGYELRYDLIEALKTLFTRADEALSSITENTTLAQLVVMPFFVDMIGNVFGEVKAADILALLPQEEYGEYLALLPEPGEMKIADYLVACLNSEELFAAVYGEAAPENCKTLGDLRLGDVIPVKDAIARAKEAVAELKNDPVGALFSLMGTEVSNAEASFEIVYSFDRSVKLTSVAAQGSFGVSTPVSSYDPTTVDMNMTFSVLSELGGNVVLRDLKDIPSEPGIPLVPSVPGLPGTFSLL